MARRIGRPSKCTPEVIAAVDKALRLRCTHELAAQAAGITLSTFQKYLAMGREEGRIPDEYTDFAETVEKAETEAAQSILALIEEAAKGTVRHEIAPDGQVVEIRVPGQWTAGAWLMERRYPHMYGRRINQIQGPNEGPVELTLRWPDSRFEDSTEEIADGGDEEGNGDGEEGEGG